ncbi:hypothetical protein DLAC_08867 [Tieghemostelium lacteum]|uniref:THH1/TOM1/TOM3 domain-containing protein n=1 Tax=Tieghemostelium lacteum TaxID=361077 RepID=A0A151Z8V9_TIELA|nr:hypothetical protein DLAC_08867 [Tieghemostelium lacteum]|eukprot:KYQ90264.1 hypothetical protein DLAC_08867 [Tieghemostelium lacteum]
MGKPFHIVLLLFTLLIYTNGFNIESSTILEKQTNVLGAELSYALLDLKFDRDIYRFKSVACPNTQCQIPAIDCSCDYTNKTDCPPVTGRDASCPPCPSDFTFSTPDGNVTLYYCLADEYWTAVEANKQYKFTTDSNTNQLNIRYKANSRICEGMRIFVEPNQGSLVMNVSPIPYFSYFGRNTPSTDTAYSAQINICPTDNQNFTSPSWTEDTYYITITPTTKYTEFNFEIISYDINNSSIAPSCTQVLSTHKCVIDGDLVSGYGANEEIHYYTYAVTQPKVIAFSFPSLLQDIDFFISDDPLLTEPNSFSKAKWDCSNERDDYLTLKLSPHPDGSPLILYIGVSTFYESEYVFTITTQGLNKPVLITDGSPKAATYSLVSSSRLNMQSGDSFSCNTWSRCSPFSIQYPYTQNLPIWPIPPEFLSDKRFQGLVFEDLQNPPEPRGYRAAFLLSNKRGDDQTVNSDLQTIMASKIEFLSTLVDAQGMALTGSYGFTLKNLTCNYQGFLNVSDRLNQEEDTLFSTTDFTKLNSVVFKINTLTMTDEWVSCQNQASSLLSVNTQNVEKMTTFCPYASTDSRFATDPCCNSSLTFFQCCVPRLMSVEQTDYIGVRDDLVEDQCHSTDCTISVLDEYKASLSTTSDCSVPGYVLEESQLEMRQVLRQCKSVISPSPCDSDSDCSSTDSKCDLFTRLCFTAPEKLDKLYLQCVFENLPKTYVFSIIYKHQLNQTDSANFLQSVFDAFKRLDCTYATGQDYRAHYEYYSEFIKPNRCYPSPRCLDLSCETVHDVCYDGNYGGWVYSHQDFIGICDSEIGLCNRKPCADGMTIPQCEADCKSIQNFCGYCSTNVSDCYTFPTLNQVQCSTAKACLLKDGLFDLSATTDPACQQKGYCDKPCGFECIGMSGCVLATATTSGACTGNHTWDATNKVCISTTATTVEECQALSTSMLKYVFVNCAANDYSQCYSDGLNHNVCHVKEIACQTKEQCEQTGGECSDRYFFSQENVLYYPEMQAKCVRGHYIWKSHWPIPTCDIYLEKDSPMGCYPYYFTIADSVADGYSENVTVNNAPIDRAQCEGLGSEFKWWVPAINQAQCTKQQGCKVVDSNQYNLPYNFRFNQMTKDLCDQCGNDVTSSWENMFKWTPGRWFPGVLVDTQWIPSDFILTGEIRELLDYEYLYEELEDSVNIHIADLYRSEALCRMERVEDNLKSISCSCSVDGDQSSQCFTSSALVLGETKPCQGEQSTYVFNNGQILFTGDSVKFACTSALISQISKQLYKSTARQSLSSSFVSYRKPDNYGVLNEKKAIIGTILTDGIKITTQGIQSLTLCFTDQSQFQEESDKYPVLDFAMENPTTTSLEPLELNIYTLTLTDNTTNKETKYICGDLNVTGSSISILPIHRLSEWADVNKEVFDKTSKGLLYTLAVFFCLTSIWGFYQLVVVAYRKYTLRERIKLVHLLILIVTLFITIRAVYFFILPSGSLSNNAVGDYILVVLPTFIYFTSFTIIIVLWYIIVKTKQTGRYMVERLTWFILVINIILYLLFMIIVLVFHYTEETPQDECGGRIIVSVSSTTPQRAVSIFYAVIQAVISLVIGAAFIYLGGTLYLAMRYKKVSESNSSSVHQQKIFIITFACSIGFILHCVFVLILVGAEPSNIVFSFLGLIVTEIIPSLSIFYSYNQGNLSGIKQVTNTNLNLQYVTNDSESFSSNKKTYPK